MPDEPSTPLPGDPQRQADATLLAFQYQLWQTVLAWLRLQPGDRLWIEQAEDFDVTSSSIANTVQVSHSPRKVTLRDAKVREAIFNCWRLEQQVGQRSFQFRYLTRGEATIEAGEPFGPGIYGLKLWSEAADPAVAKQLLDFLREERAHFPESLSRYLEQASPTDAAKSLFIPLVFELGSGDTSVIQDAVNVQLAAWAEQYGMMPAAAIKARDSLYQRVATTAGQSGDRWLTTAHLHATLVESATVVARPGFEVFMRTVEELEPSLRALAAMTSGSDTFIESPLLPPADYVSRSEVVAALRARLRPGRIVFAQGSTGMGKTTLAKALAAAEPGIWQWMAMAGLRGEAVVQRLRALAARIVRENQTPHIILDDVDVSSSAHAGLSHAFAVLVVSLSQRNGEMLATTQTLPSARVAEVCGDDSDLIFSVPRMGYQEIRETARLLGCPGGQMQQDWARVARVRSQGHPQLARAVLLNAKSRGWPQPSWLDQTADESIGNVRTEARRLVAALSDSEKELLFRLSLVTGRFRREHALALGAEPPPLSHPGEAFDPLIGAWVESLSGGFFRVSPLLVDAAENIFSEERIRELHIQVARAFFAQNVMSPQEGAQAFEHAWEARHGPALGGLVSSLFEQPGEVFEAMSSHVAWFVVEGLTEGDVLLPDDPRASLLLRMFQARIAAENVPAVAGRVFHAWRAEIEQNQPPAARPSALYLLAIQALGHGEVTLSAKDTVQYLGMFFDAETNNPELRAMANEQIVNVPAEVADELHYDSLAGLQAVLSFNRCRSVAWLDEWTTAVENAPPELRESILRATRLNPWWSAFMVDAAWLDEERKAQPDWEQCLVVLARVRSFAVSAGVPALAFAAVRAATVIRDEYQHNPAAALRELEDFLSTTEAPHPRLLDARAAVLFHLEDFPAAVAAWDEVLATWQPENIYDHYPAFAARTRAIALARMGDLSGAARGFTDARRRIPSGDETPQAAGLLADAGLCWWNVGDYPSAFAALTEAAREADSLPPGHSDLLAFRMRRMVGHIVTVLHGPLSGWAIEGQVEPPPGAASDLNTPDVLKELPEGAFEYTWAMLDSVANLLGLNERIPISAQTKLAKSPLPTVRFLTLQTEIERAFRLGQLATLPSLAERIEQEFAAGLRLMRGAAMPQQGVEASPPPGWRRESDVSGEKLFSAALVAASTRGAGERLIESWRSDAVGQAWGSGFSTWLDHAEILLTVPVTEAAARIRHTEGLSLTDGVLLAARVATDADVAPPDSLWSQVQLVLGFARDFWRPAIGHSLAEICAKSWLHHSEHPALLRDPRLTVTAITKARTSSRVGIAKAAAIVLAASGTTSLRMSGDMREQLEKLQANDLPIFQLANPFREQPG
jgi:hypothetical protein